MKQIFILFFATICALGRATNLPSSFAICKTSDPRVDNCLKNAVQAALPLLKNGIKELGLQPLDPMVIPSVEIGEGSQAVRFTQKYKNFNIVGFADSSITSFKSNLDSKNFWIEIVSKNSEIQYLADYDVNGKLLILPIKGQGKSSYKFKNPKLILKITGEEITKKGKQYIKVTNTTVSTEIEGMRLHLENLFDGNKELGDQINNVLNDNWKEVYNDVSRSYEQLLETVFLDYVNKIFLKIPFEDLFPK